MEYNRFTISDIAKISENATNEEVKPETNIVINTNRLWYGKNTTVSAFLATAYDEHANKVNSMGGFFLEPETDYEKAKLKGKDKSVMYGSYNIVPRQYHWQKYHWYVDKVPGRTGIAIHKGNSGEDTEGCLMPGEKFYYDNNIKDYRIKCSKKKEEELFQFFAKYGKNGIRINIGV